MCANKNMNTLNANFLSVSAGCVKGKQFAEVICCVVPTALLLLQWSGSH